MKYKISWRDPLEDINRGHNFEEKVHKKDVEEEEGGCGGLNTCCKYCPTPLMLGVLYTLLNDFLGLWESRCY